MNSGRNQQTTLRDELRTIATRLNNAADVLPEQAVMDDGEVCKWVELSKAQQMTGYSYSQLRSYKTQYWTNGVHWRTNPAGKTVFNLREIDKWQESEPLPVDTLVLKSERTVTSDCVSGTAVNGSQSDVTIQRHLEGLKKQRQCAKRSTGKAAQG